MKLYYNRRSAGKRLKKRRKELHITASQMAENIGKTPNYYSDIERGVCGMSIETLIQMSNRLELSLDYILFGEAAREENLSQADVAFRTLQGWEEEIQRNAVKLMRTYLHIAGK